MQRMRVPTFVWIVPVLLSVGCKRSSATVGDGIDAASLVASPDAGATSDIDAAPAKRVARRSFASFEKDALNECLDIALVDEQGTADQAALEVRMASGAKHLPKDLVPLKKSCAEQFVDRTSLASCLVVETLPADAGMPGIKSVMMASYYSVRTLNDDVYMRDCLKMGGEWEAAKKDDPAAARERLRQRAKALQDLAGK